MSDEPTPPPLRLKPRVRPDGDPVAPPASPAPAPAPAAEPAAESAPRLRLKPKLAEPVAEPQPQPATPAPAPAATVPPAATIPPSPAAPPPPPAAEPAGSEPPKFKLKVRPPEPAVPAVAAPAAPVAPPAPAVIPAPESMPPAVIPAPAAAPTPAAAVPAAPEPPKFPLVAGEATSAARSHPPPPVPHLRAPSGMKEEELLPGAGPSRRRLPVKLLALAGVAVIALGAGAFFFLQDSAPSLPPPAPKRPAKTPASAAAPAQPGPTPSATLNAIAAAPGAAIHKAQDAVAARRNLEQERVNAMAAGEDVPEERALDTPPPAALTPANSHPADPKPAPSVAIRATSELAPGVSATTTVSEMSGNASPGFQAWVANVRINGVFQGSPPRALINGRAVRAGQSVDDSLGIVFDSVDAQARTITFRDGTGATLSRRY